MTIRNWKLPKYSQGFSSRLVRHADVHDGEPIIYRFTRSDTIHIAPSRQPAFLFTVGGEKRFNDIYLEDIGLCSICGATWCSSSGTRGRNGVCDNCIGARATLQSPNSYILELNNQVFSISADDNGMIRRSGEADLHPRVSYMLFNMIAANYLVKTNNITQSSVLSMNEYVFLLIAKRQRGCVSTFFRGFGVHIVNDHMRPIVDAVSGDKLKIMAIAMIDFSSESSGKGRDYPGVVYSGVRRKVYFPSVLANYKVIAYVNPEFADYFDEEFYTGPGD